MTADAFAFCQNLVRENDKDRFFAALFAPAERRPSLYAVFAFAIEIAGIALRANEPLAGEVRLQWWRDVVDGIRPGEATASPVAAALLTTIAAAGLPVQALRDAIDAHTRDLERFPIASMEDFVGYALDTDGAIMRCAAHALGSAPDDVTSAPLRDAAAARGALRVLRQFAMRASRGQIFLPKDLLERHGVDPNDILAGRLTAGISAALAEFRKEGRAHADRAVQRLGSAPAALRPAMFDVALVPLYLDRMERADYQPFATPVDVPLWRRQWRLWRAARSGGG